MQTNGKDNSMMGSSNPPQEGNGQVQKDAV